MDQLQRGYYRYPFVAEVLGERANAIRSVLPRGSRLLDLGCNDGTISSVLLKSGYASSSLGVDFEDARRAFPPSFSFLAADLRELDLSCLPNVDVVLCLNVLHHLFLQGTDFARTFMAALSKKAGVVLCDFGSLTVRGDRSEPWETAMRAAWKSDEECWAEMFAPFKARRALLTYPFQHGRRVLWKLTTEREPAYRHTVLEESARGRRLRRLGTEEELWADGGSLAPAAVVQLLRTSPFDCLLPLAHDVEHGDVYAYDAEVAEGGALTPEECQRLLPERERARVQAFSDQQIPTMGQRPLRELCTFKVARTSRGLTFLGFRPRG